MHCPFSCSELQIRRNAFVFVFLSKLSWRPIGVRLSNLFLLGAAAVRISYCAVLLYLVSVGDAVSGRQSFFKVVCLEDLRRNVERQL